MKFFDRLLRRNRTQELAERQTIVRRGLIVEEATRTEFYQVLMDECAKLHEEYLTAAMTRPEFAIGAYAMLELTKRLESYILKKDDALSAKTARHTMKSEWPVPGTDRSPVTGAEPHAI